MFILSILFYILSILVSVILHEYAHGFISYKLGDPTPSMDGRLSFNPKNHINKIGFILLLVLIVFSLFGFGGYILGSIGILVAVSFAKPVIINPGFYKNPQRDRFLVAMAGPFMNILLSIIGIFFIFFYAGLSGYGYSWLSHIDSNIILMFLWNFCRINLSLAIFNLIPVPPLDGFSILTYIFPSIDRYQKSGNLIFLQYIFIIFLLGPLGGVVGSYMNFMINEILYVFNMVFGSLFAVLF